MRLFDYLAFLLSALFYLPRLALFYLYRVLLFVSKPASMILLPALLGGLLYWQRDIIPNSWPYQWWIDVVMRYIPHERIPQDYWYLGFFWVCFTFLLYLLTGGRFQILGTVLSALPRISRPFPPTLRLRLVEKKIRAAPVSLSVPSLKRRRGLKEPDLTQGLAEPLKRLLEAPERPEAAQGASSALATPQALPEPPEAVPQPREAKVEPKARPTRKPSAPPLPPKARA